MQISFGECNKDLHPSRLNSCRNVSLNFRTERDPNLKTTETKTTLFNIMAHCLALHIPTQAKTALWEQPLEQTGIEFSISLTMRLRAHKQPCLPLVKIFYYWKVVRDCRNSINSLLMMQQNAFHKWQTKYVFNEDYNGRWAARQAQQIQEKTIQMLLTSEN